MIKRMKQVSPGTRFPRDDSEAAYEKGRYIKPLEGNPENIPSTRNMADAEDGAVTSDNIYDAKSLQGQGSGSESQTRDDHTRQRFIFGSRTVKGAEVHRVPHDEPYKEFMVKDPFAYKGDGYDNPEAGAVPQGDGSIRGDVGDAAYDTHKKTQTEGVNAFGPKIQEHPGKAGRFFTRAEANPLVTPSAGGCGPENETPSGIFKKGDGSDSKISGYFDPQGDQPGQIESFSREGAFKFNPKATSEVPRMKMAEKSANKALRRED